MGTPFLPSHLLPPLFNSEGGHSRDGPVKALYGVFDNPILSQPIQSHIFPLPPPFTPLLQKRLKLFANKSPLIFIRSVSPVKLHLLSCTLYNLICALS